MLSQSIRRLEKIQSCTTSRGTQVGHDELLRALWHRSRELHYVAHFREPLDVDTGDIGYITGDPPQFTRLANVSNEIQSGKSVPGRGIQRSRFTPRNRWTTRKIKGVVRWMHVWLCIWMVWNINSCALDTHFVFVTLTPQSLLIGAVRGLVWIKTLSWGESISRTGAVQNQALLSIVLGRGIAWRNVPMTWRQIMLNVLLVHQILYLVC